MGMITEAAPLTSAETQRQNVAVVEAYFGGLARHDHAAVEALFADHIVETIPLGPSGDPAPWVVYTGKKAVTRYAHLIMANFERVQFAAHPEYTVSADGRTVFVEAHGKLIAAQGHRPYPNVYVFKFVVENGLLVHIAEYANPVTYAKLMGLPIG